AGLGGLTAGALLAKQGRKVLVLEQAEMVGGCCATFERDGFRFDIGASIVEALANMELVFTELGSSLETELDLLPCDPIYSCIFRDGKRLSIPRDVQAAADAIGQLSAPDRENFIRFNQCFEQFAKSGGDEFFRVPMNTMGDFAGLFQRNPGMLRFLPFFFGTYDDALKKFFVDERVRQTMAYQSFYAGHPPDLAPGIFAIIPAFLEHLGMYYPRGGMGKIPTAIAMLGQQYGLEVRLKTPVARVLVDGSRAVQGVRLEDGAIITSKVVVSNVNARTLYLELIGKENLPWNVRKGIESLEPSLTAPMVYLGLDAAPPLDAHHTLIPLPVEQMNDAWWNEYRAGRIPKEQFGLLCWPTQTDPSLAPAGCHVLNLILMGPYDLKATNWDAEKPRFIEQTLDLLDRFIFPGVKKHVKVADMSTPLDYERRLRLPGGAIYGLQQDITAQAVFRPSSRSKSFSGLYLTGASTHPGGGVPTSMCSGYIAANLIAKSEIS
ncbi:MAG TPA: NAD(P)/FAD-dependent oxidoreductase, partial [Anaerolineaceae bacterium]|nr:NAD(P)/FAD-dependent oxidoreductase [Anaerolineaceae bacterium]